MSGVIYILFILHLLLSITYSMDSRDGQGNTHRTLLKFVVCFCIPVFGFAFMLFSDYFEHRLDKVTGRNLNELNAIAAELDILNPLDVSDELNKVPVVEALQMADYSYRRKVIVDTLKADNTLEYIDVLKEALLNEDMETSHYASSVIMDIQGKLQAALLQKEVEFQEHPEKEENAGEYEEELYKVITSGIYDKRDLQKYYIKYKVVSDYLLSHPVTEEKYYHDRIVIDFETENLVHAREVCERYKNEFPYSEEMVVDYIKFFVYQKDREGLDEFFRQLKTMPVVLTTNSLQYIRFFERANG